VTRQPLARPVVGQRPRSQSRAMHLTQLGRER
jgi:hypothetical protein